MKREAPFHEMIPRKSTINTNLKSSKNPWKICVKKFIFSKFAGLQAYSRQLYYQMNSFTGIFRQYLKPSSHAPPMYWLKPPPIRFWRATPPMFSTPVGSPGVSHTSGIFTVDGFHHFTEDIWRESRAETFVSHYFAGEDMWNYFFYIFSSVLWLLPLWLFLCTKKKYSFCTRLVVTNCFFDAHFENVTVFLSNFASVMGIPG